MKSAWKCGFPLIDTPYCGAKNSLPGWPGRTSCQGTSGLTSPGLSRALDLDFYLTSQLLIEMDVKSCQHSPEQGNASVTEDYVATMRNN